MASASYFDQFNLKEIEKLDLYANQVVEGFIIGLHKSPYHGFSVEFAEHRHYNPGESTKNIDWKVYGRTDKLYKKRFEEETNLRCQLVLDASSSMFYPEYEVAEGLEINKFSFSALASASLMNVLKRQRDAFGLTLFDQEILNYNEPKSSRKQYQLLLQTLHNKIISPPEQKETNTAQALHEIAERAHKRSMVIIFSDFFSYRNELDELKSALQHLKFAKHEVILFHVLDKKTEIDFDFPNKPYEFIDLETNERIKLQSDDIKKQYQQEANKFIDDLRTTCIQYQIDYQIADMKEGFVPVLNTFFKKRKRMGV